jgi:hypothetical protein
VYVEEAPGEYAGCASLDARDVPIDAVLEGEDVETVDGQRLVVEAKHVHEHRLVRQEQLAAPRGLHQPQALTGGGLFDEP